MVKRSKGAATVAICLAASLTAGGCIRPYKIDIQQGNVVPADVAAELREGMTKREVRYLMGTPLVADPFHDDRWDYYYAFRKGGAKQREQKRITVVFEDDRVVRIDGDVEAQAVDVRALSVPDDDTPPGTEQPGIFERTWNKVRGKGDDAE